MVKFQKGKMKCKNKFQSKMWWNCGIFRLIQGKCQGVWVYGRVFFFRWWWQFLDSRKRFGFGLKWCTNWRFNFWFFFFFSLFFNIFKLWCRMLRVTCCGEKRRITLFNGFLVLFLFYFFLFSKVENKKEKKKKIVSILK